jgi:hypothetical protein
MADSFLYFVPYRYKPQTDCQSDRSEIVQARLLKGNTRAVWIVYLDLWDRFMN